MILLFSAALDICPTREEKVLLTVSKRACQSVASRITGSALGIFSNGVSAFELRLTQRFTIGSEIVFIINDGDHAKIYNDMIEKREAEICSLEKKIADLRHYDEVCKKRREELKNTSELIETILADRHISNVNLKMLVRQVTVHQNEDKSIDISFDMNGAFNYNIMEDVTTDIL